MRGEVALVGVWLVTGGLFEKVIESRRQTLS
jgi:ATP-dependent Lon protease